ncbi:MAG: sirohydrochlorin chelatase [Mycobacterium sp.]
MSYLLVAHGTRKAEGVAMVVDMAAKVAATLDSSVHVAFVDVVGPTPTEVLTSPALRERPVVVVPAFLSRGYHVRTDIPAHVEASGHPAVTMAAALGPCPQMVRVVADRLVESGWRQGDSVVLGTAGTFDTHALRDLRVTATLLSATIGSRVELAYAATGEPRVSDAVAALRQRGARRVVIASYLLADGLFQDRLEAGGADLVTAPLGTHPATIRVIANRFRRAHLPLAV